MSSAKISEGMLFDNNKNEPMKITDLPKNAVIHCPTQAEWNAIVKLCKDAGMTCTLNDDHYWNIYKERSCIIQNNQTHFVHYCYLEYYFENSYIIHHAAAFLPQIEKDVVATAQTPSNSDSWISVKDRLPELGMVVLCIDNKKWQSVCFYGNYSVDENHKFYKHDLDYYFELEDVTHWQPLPKPPTILSTIS